MDDDLLFIKSNQIQPKRISITNIFPLFLNSIFSPILLLSILFSFSFENSEITIYFKVTGNDIYIINKEFYKDPSQIIVNGELRETCKKTCTFEETPNTVVIKFEDVLESTENMFKDMTDILEIDLTNFDFSKVESMASMFYNCKYLQKIIFGNMDTSSVKNMNQLFDGCQTLTSIDLSKFKTSSVTNMRKLFSNCGSLKSIDLTSFNTQNVENIEDLFGGCQQLTSVDFSKFDSSKVKNMRGVFYNCYKLLFLDLSNFSTDSLNNIPYMFSGCKALIYLNIRPFKINSGVWTEAIFRSTPSYLKICLEDSSTKELLSSTGKTFDCSNTCFNKEINFKLDLVNHECVTNCNQHYEYGNYCYSSCPAGTYPKEDEYSCLKYLEKGYYISYYLENSVYKKCY